MGGRPKRPGLGGTEQHLSGGPAYEWPEHYSGFCLCSFYVYATFFFFYICNLATSLSLSIYQSLSLSIYIYICIVTNNNTNHNTNTNSSSNNSSNNSNNASNHNGRFPKFHRVSFDRDPGTLRSDIVSNKHPQLNCSDLRLSN